MKTYTTKNQHGYVINAINVPLNVHAVMEDGTRTLLLTAEKPGQYGIVAISGEVELDRDDAVFTEPRGTSGTTIAGASAAGARPYILPPATADDLGGIKIGSELSTGTDGTVTVNWAKLPTNVFRTDQTTSVTGKTSFTKPLSVGTAVSGTDAVTLGQIESQQGIKLPSQIDYRIMAPVKGLADPVSYMDRVYNMSTDKIVAFGQTNGLNGGDGNNYAWRATTTVLDLPDLTETLRQDSANPSSSSIGQTAYFGLTAQMPARDFTSDRFIMMKDAANKVVPRYDIPSHFFNYYNSSVAFRSIPAVFSSDYHADRKLRTGFVPSSIGWTYEQAISRLDDEQIYKYALLACLPNDAIRLIQVWGGYNGTTTRLFPANYHGLWVERKNGERIFLGMTLSNYSFCRFGLILAPFGSSGVGSCRMYEGDIFGLATGDRLPTSCYPLDRSMSVVEAAGGTRVSNILLPDKSYTFVKADDFLTLTDNGAGQLTVTVAPNDSGAERRGLVDITLSNGLTYSIHITQQA